MSWEQLKDITEIAKRNAAVKAHEPPTACPIDGEPLQVRADGARNCPMGNFTWRG